MPDSRRLRSMPLDRWPTSTGADPGAGLPQPALVLAHCGRGLSHAFPDNSLAAFEATKRTTADGVELDVRATQDGVLVCAHDSRIGGLTIAETSAGELRAALGPASPPTLEDVARLAEGRLFLDVELKEEGTTARAIDTVFAHIPAGAMCVTSFIDSVIEEARRLRPSVAAGLLVHDDDRDAPPDLLKRARQLGANFLAPHRALVTAELLETALAERMGMVVWTVNDDAEAGALAAHPAVAAVITDTPDLVTLAGRPQRPGVTAQPGPPPGRDHAGR